MALSLEDVKLVADIASNDATLAARLLARLQDTQTVTITRDQLVPQQETVTEEVAAETAQAEITFLEVPLAGNRKLTDAQRDRIVANRLYLGHTLQQLSDDFGVSKQTISYTLKKGEYNQITNRGPGRSPINPALQRVLQDEYYAGGTSRAKLAKKYGISEGAVKRYTPPLNV